MAEGGPDHLPQLRRLFVYDFKKMSEDSLLAILIEMEAIIEES